MGLFVYMYMQPTGNCEQLLLHGVECVRGVLCPRLLCAECYVQGFCTRSVTSKGFVHARACIGIVFVSGALLFHLSGFD